MNKAQKAVIEFVCTVAQVKTLADGGIRVSLDLPETEVMTAAQLMECKRASGVLKMTAQVVDDTQETRV